MSQSVITTNGNSTMRQQMNSSVHVGHTDRLGAKPAKFINTSSTVMGHASGMALTPQAVMSKSIIAANISAGSGGGEQSSTMIEKEKRAIEKIRMRQKKEVEQMMEMELQLERIRKSNEEKAVKQREKEMRRMEEVRLAQLEQDERKRREEQRLREKAEIEAFEQKKRAEE